LSFVLDNKKPAIILCTLMAIVSLVVKLGQGIIDARVMSNREFWFAEQIRRLPETDAVFKIPKRELSRGSHYYGRLASSVLQIIASGIVFIVTYVICLLLMKPMAIAIIVIATIILGAMASVVGLFVGRKLKVSATGLVERATNVALWKGNNATETEIYSSRWCLLGLC